MPSHQESSKYPIFVVQDLLSILYILCLKKRKYGFRHPTWEEQNRVL